VSAKPLPNIALFAGNRTWKRDFNADLWRSSDGWVITEQQIMELPLDEGSRLFRMLKDGHA
jgi:hypothetical protein